MDCGSRLTMSQTRRQYWTEWGWWALLAAVIVGGLLLTGCATVADDLDFIEQTARANATPSPNYPPMIVRVDYPDLVCTKLGAVKTQDGTIAGCADYKGVLRDYTCMIFVGSDAPAWIIAHEKAHCKYGKWHK